jgi:hypothetical protein
VRVLLRPPDVTCRDELSFDRVLAIHLLHHVSDPLRGSAGVSPRATRRLLGMAADLRWKTSTSCDRSFHPPSGTC